MFFAQLIFDPEDGGAMFLQNIGSYADLTALYPRKWQLLYKNLLPFTRSDSIWALHWKVV
jgi:hypothetical protein